MLTPNSSLAGVDCVVLAGGFGHRLGLSIPKILAPAVWRVPFLHLLLRWFRIHGATDVVFILGWEGELVERALMQANRPREFEYLNLRIFQEKPPFKGTGEALRRAEPFLTANNSRFDPIYVCNGDTLIDADLSLFRQIHRANMPSRTSRLLVRSYPVGSGMHTGAYLFERAGLKYGVANVPGDSLETVMLNLNHSDITLEGSYHDIGTPERLRATADYVRRIGLL